MEQHKLYWTHAIYRVHYKMMMWYCNLNIIKFIQIKGRYKRRFHVTMMVQKVVFFNHKMKERMECVLSIANVLYAQLCIIYLSLIYIFVKWLSTRLTWAFHCRCLLNSVFKFFVNNVNDILLVISMVQSLKNCFKRIISNN